LPKATLSVEQRTRYLHDWGMRPYTSNTLTTQEALEADLIAKYVEKMIRGESANSSLTVERLVSEGF